LQYEIKVITVRFSYDQSHQRTQAKSQTLIEQKNANMRKREPVSAIMSTDLFTVQRNSHSLRDVKQIFEKNEIRHVPVMDGNNLIGIISKNDLLRLDFGAVFENQGEGDEAILDMLTIDQLMTHSPKSIPSDMPIRVVAETFVEEKFHALPVMDGEKLIGIVTSTDVIEYMLEQY